MFKLSDFVHSFNVEVGGIKIDDVAEKIGSVFGEEGREIGKKIDDITKDIIVKIPSDN